MSIGLSTSNKNLAQIVRELRSKLQLAKKSGLDLSKVDSPEDSPSYRLQGKLDSSCSRASVRCVDEYGWGIVGSDEINEVLDLLDQARNIFGNHTPLSDRTEGFMAFLIQNCNRPDIQISPKYAYLRDYKLPD